MTTTFGIHPSAIPSSRDAESSETLQKRFQKWLRCALKRSRCLETRLKIGGYLLSFAADNGLPTPGPLWQRGLLDNKVVNSSSG
eukprot:5219675-Prymnesium_polylepis.1